MKNKNIIIALTAVLLSFSFISCEKEKPISPSNLPSEITNYISTHFPNHKVIRAVEDKEGLSKNYEIYLDGNIKLEFNRQKETIEIDGTSKLPDSVISEKIRQYVAENYPDNVITDWEIEGNNQQVGLDNGIDLEFNMNGDFLRID